VDEPRRAAAIIDALGTVADSVPLIFPMHPRGAATLEAAGIARHRRIVVTAPLGYLEFMSLVAESSVVITDSGGIQEETSILGIPCLTVRPNTERPITITSGTNKLVEPDAIPAAASAALHTDHAPADIPLWDGNAGRRIAEILHRA
jgi:UDP-N-acetylglucosamine 2-epimerase (non-hydrolysing)